MHVDLADSRRLAERSIGLAQVAAPLREVPPVLLVLDEVPGLAVGREEPGPRLLGIDGATEPHRPDQAADHLARERDVERAILAAFRLGDPRGKVWWCEIDAVDRDWLSTCMQSSFV